MYTSTSTPSQWLSKHWHFQKVDPIIVVDPQISPWFLSIFQWSLDRAATDVSNGKCNHCSRVATVDKYNLLPPASSPPPPPLAQPHSPSSPGGPVTATHKYNETLDIYHSQYQHCLTSMPPWIKANLTHCPGHDRPTFPPFSHLQTVQ